jgi:hypothetical protein
MTPTPCPACHTRPRRPRQYLCGTCWAALPPAARRALTSRGPAAITRLQQLHDQLADGVPLTEIQVTP